MRCSAQECMDKFGCDSNMALCQKSAKTANQDRLVLDEKRVASKALTTAKHAKASQVRSRYTTCSNDYIHFSVWVKLLSQQLQFQFYTLTYGITGRSSYILKAFVKD
eukprot:3276739-Amphidinium_carterae.1